MTGNFKKKCTRFCKKLRFQENMQICGRINKFWWDNENVNEMWKMR